MNREKQLKILEKLADIKKIQKFKTFYGLYAAIENLHFKTTMSYSTCEKLLINNCDEILEIEV